MKRFNFRSIDSRDLVDRYLQVSLAQDDAIENFRNTRYNRLYDEKVAIEAELKSRRGDERRRLLQFYRHEKLQVSLNAAQATLAIAPVEATAELQRIRETKLYPQAADAGLTLDYLEEGRLIPE